LNRPTSSRVLNLLGTAGSFGVAASELAELSPDLIVITADLRHFSGLDRFAERFPEKFVNVGIAEQNMIGVAAGLTTEGFQVFATTYATFASARAADPVRVNLSYGESPVKVVGMASGFSAGLLGPTHMGLEDIAMFRSLPSMSVICASDGAEAYRATKALIDWPGPAYLRLGGPVPTPAVSSTDFAIGKIALLREGQDVAILATGGGVHPAVEAGQDLAARGISAQVANVHTLKPLDVEFVTNVLKSSQVVATVEDHSVVGGLGSAISEIAAELGHVAPVVRFGADGGYPHAADYGHLMQASGLSGDSIAQRLIEML